MSTMCYRIIKMIDNTVFSPSSLSNIGVIKYPEYQCSKRKRYPSAKERRRDDHLVVDKKRIRCDERTNEPSIGHFRGVPRRTCGDQHAAAATVAGTPPTTTTRHGYYHTAAVLGKHLYGT